MGHLFLWCHLKCIDKLLKMYIYHLYASGWTILFLLTFGIISLLLWNSSTFATSCEELTHWKRLWCWEGLGAGGEGDDRGWDGWMASLIRWMWIWVNSGSWWWTGRPGVLRFMGSQRVGHDWATELNWTKLCDFHFHGVNSLSSCLFFFLNR